MPKYNAEFKEKIAKEYLSGEGSTRYLGMKYGVNARTVWDWAMKYKGQENIVLNITVIIKELQASMMFHIAKSILG